MTDTEKQAKSLESWKAADTAFKANNLDECNARIGDTGKNMDQGGERWRSSHPDQLSTFTDKDVLTSRRGPQGLAVILQRCQLRQRQGFAPEGFQFRTASFRFRQPCCGLLPSICRREVKRH